MKEKIRNKRKQNGSRSNITGRKGLVFFLICCLLQAGVQPVYAGGADVESGAAELPEIESSISDIDADEYALPEAVGQQESGIDSAGLEQELNLSEESEDEEELLEIAEEEEIYGSGEEELLLTGDGVLTNEKKAKAISMKLNTDYTVLWNKGEDTWFRYTAEETGYYGISTAGYHGGEYGLIYFNPQTKWYSQNPTVSGSFRVFLIQGWEYYFGASTYEPTPPDDPTECRDGKPVAYTLKLSKAGFGDFTSGCPVWNAKETDSTKVTLPAANTKTRYFRPIAMTVPKNGTYEITVKHDTSVASTNVWPILLNSTGAVVCPPKDYSEAKAVVTVALTAGETYYVLPMMMMEDMDSVIELSIAPPAPKEAQIIYASDVTKTYGDAPFTLDAMTSADGTLSYTCSDASVATIGKNDGKVTIKGTGTANIVITASETTDFAAASKTIKLTVKSKPTPTTAPKPMSAPAPTSAPAPAAAPPSVTYRTHVQTYGWQPFVSDGVMSGTSGESKRLEGIEIRMASQPYTGSIVYRTHVQTYGWQDWRQDGAMSGTSGESKRLEGIQIYLTGEMAEHYDVYYRVHAQTYGWLDFAKNGEMAGTSGLSKRLEGINICLVEKGGAAPGSTSVPYVVGGSGSLPENPADKTLAVAYRTHVQTYGWQPFVVNGTMSGTSGQSKRLEGIEIRLNNQPYAGDIIYRTHVQTYGWQDWRLNGAMSGTSGEAKRLEGIQIYLTGEMAKHYDIYYRVHAQTYGWLDFAKNGEMAGTSGLSRRLEGMEVVLAEKGTGAPGSTKRPNIVGNGGSLPDNPYKE